MALPLLCQVGRRCPVMAFLTVARREYASSPPTPPSLLNRFLLQLYQHFYDVEGLLRWSSNTRTLVVRRKNAFFGYTQRKFGINVAAAYHVLSLGGSFRFSGESEWFRPNSRGKFSYDFLNTPNSTIEEIDLSGTLINHDGLDNIMSQKGLRSLSLKGCPEVDDWFLARLHVFGETLQELDLSHCPRVTEGGLPALQHLRKLRRLDVSSLPRLENPGLVRILLEEMLPHCEVSGAEYEQGLILTAEQDPETETGGDGGALTR